MLLLTIYDPTKPRIGPMLLLDQKSIKVRYIIHFDDSLLICVM